MYWLIACGNLKGSATGWNLWPKSTGCAYINDSKGTNLDAAIKALGPMKNRLSLIAGGKNKGSDFSLFAGKVKEKARALVVLGQSAQYIAAAARDKGFENIPVRRRFPEAVQLALVQPGR